MEREEESAERVKGEERVKREREGGKREKDEDSASNNI